MQAWPSVPGLNQPLQELIVLNSYSHCRAFLSPLPSSSSGPAQAPQAAEGTDRPPVAPGSGRCCGSPGLSSVGLTIIPGSQHCV